MNTFVRRLALAILLPSAIFAAQADNTPQALPFNQTWSTTTQIMLNDNWSGVAGVEGYLGQDITTTTGTNPQTLTGVSASGTDLDVIANQAAPNTNTAGGVAEFDGIANPSVALQGSGTADAPYLLINISTTGQSGINVAYNLRDLDGSVDNAVMPVALQYRVGNSGAFTNVPGGFVADATTGPSLATLVTAVSTVLPAAVDNQALVQVRIITANAVGNDEWVGVDDIAITSGVVSQPSLSISNTSAAEGDSGTTAFMFTISLNQAAGAGGVNVDFATADGTATTADSDYIAKLGTVTIAEGNTSVTISVDVNGDTTTEANQTFFVNLSNASGALIADAQGVGTINNDDVTLTAIHAIQGSGATSPLAGNTVTTRGIVTGRKSNGFFIQTADADADADSATSQGVFVFTSTAPSTDAAVGNLVQVGATVTEYIPTADPGQAPLTELTFATVTLLSAGNALPTAVSLSTSLPDPAGALGQLERHEGMRVTAPSFTVVAPTKGNTNEPNATGTSNGIFSVVVTGVARPFREPGIQVPDPDPSGSTATAIPRWDFNPEQITVDSDALGGTQLNVPAGTVLTNLVGPLDFGFRRYTLLADAGTTVGVTAGPAPSAARLATADELTVASYNLERFFDTINDPAIGEPVLTATAFANRLNKASLAIRNFLNTPDIIGVVEVENLSTLQALATRINDDAVAASQPNPQYTAHLMEGNDIGGIDVGFLLKSAEVGPVVPRVEFEDLLQLGKDFTWLDPSDNTQKLLNDRPPLLLQTIIHFPDGRKFPLTAIVVHQRSLNGSTSEAPDGVVTEGFRVRAKRQAQAEFLANQIQLRQTTSDPAERIVVVGDFNAFEFNDGLADAMNVVEGTPTADNETAVNGDGADLVTPDLINLAALEPATERYSFVFDGNAQSLDHVLINDLLSIDAGFDLDHARINADFPETNRNDANSPSRLSDHDPAVAYFSVGSADLATTASANPANVGVGGTMTFEVSVTNNGPDAAESVGVGFALDAEVPDLGVTAPAGWSCDAPTVGTGTTTVACNKSSMANGGYAFFRVTGTVPASEPGSTINLAVLAIAGTPDPDETDNDAAAAVNVLSVDLATSITGPVRTATTVTYAVVLRNNGPSPAPGGMVRITSNIPMSIVTFSNANPEWTCMPAQLDAPLVTTCYKFGSGTMPVGGSVQFTVTIPSHHHKSAYWLRSEVSTYIPDPVPANNVATRRLAMPQL